MPEVNIIIHQAQEDGNLLTQYPKSLDTNIAYDNSETNYDATNINEAFLMTLRAPNIQVVYNA